MSRGLVRLVTSLLCVMLAAGLTGCGQSVSKLRKDEDIYGLAAIAEKKNQDFTKIQDAADALGEIATPEAVQRLSQWVSGDDDSLRTAAIPALGAAGSPMGVEPLVGELGELDSASPTYAEDLRAIVSALGDIDDPASARILVTVAERGGSAVIGEAYMGRALAKQGVGISPELTRLMRSKESAVFLPAGVATYIRNAGDPKRIRSMLRKKQTQRVWAGVFTEAAEGSHVKDLIYALDHYNDKELAGRMLNAGDDKLKDAATKWAGEHGFKVETLSQYAPPK